MAKLLVLIFFTLSLSPVYGQYEKKKERAKRANLGNTADLRDPFKRKRFKRKTLRKRKFGGTNFNNLPSIEGVSLDQIQIVGVLLGESRRAIARIMDANGKGGKDSYTLREGMKLGLNNAEIKAILPGGIVLVEKIRNVYDEDEYLETILPVSIE